MPAQVAIEEGPGHRPTGRVVGLGVVVVDLLAIVERYPRVDTKQDVRHSQIQVGGPVPTALAQLAIFGHRCRLQSIWGDDAFGDVIEQDLADARVEFDPVCRTPGINSGHSQVWIEASTGRRTSVTQRSDAADFELTPAASEVIRRSRLLHLDGWPSPAALHAADLARSAGVPVSVDTGSSKPGIDDVLRRAEIVNAPRRFIEERFHLTDIAEGARRLADMGPSIVTVTDGEQGAVMYAADRVLRTSVLEGAAIVDTNGAGDVFSAGILHAVLSKWSPEKALRFATAAAGLKCRQLGNRKGLSDAERVLAAAESLIID